MGWTARYYYKIEAYLVLGWLEGKYVDALTPKDKILSDLQLPILSPDKTPSKQRFRWFDRLFWPARH
jgi:hypothetical protein